MNSSVNVIVLSILFLAVIMLLDTFNKKNKYATTIVACITLLGGFVLYGVGYAAKEDDLFIAAFKTATSAIKMFAGGDGGKDIVDTWIFQYPVVLYSFEFVHFMALAVTAKAVLFTFSAGLIRRLLLFFKRKGKLVIIYGVNETSIKFGSSLNKDRKKSVVYVDDKSAKDYSNIIKSWSDGILISDENAVNPTESFLKQIGAFNSTRKIIVYTLSDDEVANIDYATKLNKVLKEQTVIPKDNVSLTLLANMEMEYGNMFQADENEKYGFGSVLTLDIPYIAARHLVSRYAPCNYVSFDKKKGVATSDFNAVIVGFGKLGQAVLRKLVMNAQFVGSNFHVTVYDPNMNAIAGNIKSRYGSMFEQYDIVLKQADARSEDLFDDLKKNTDINYVAVCIGDEQINNEVAADIETFAIRTHRDIDVFRCTKDFIFYHNAKENIYKKNSNFERANLDIELTDAKAMALNFMYCSNNVDGDDKTPLDYWVNAGFLDKMSSRASADFLSSMCEMVGLSEEDILKNGLSDLTEEQMVNLSITEHLRWCAFQYAFGYETMPAEVWEKRVNDYKAEVAAKGSSKIKIQKDDYNRFHACLIDWDELDALSERFSQATGKDKDYKNDDRSNVEMLPEVLRISRKYLKKDGA